MINDPSTNIVALSAQNTILVQDDWSGVPLAIDWPWIRDWLHKNQGRQVGWLLLNPHCPHRSAESQDKQANSDSAIEARRIIHEQLSRSRGFCTAVYDLPLGHSAVYADINFGRTGSIVSANDQLFFSRANEVSLQPCSEYGKQEQTTENVEAELLGLWLESLLHRPGHGISIVLPWTSPPRDAVFDRLVHNFLEKMELQDALCRTFSSGQLHVTAASLCRTQTGFLSGPLSVGADDPDQRLPDHFPVFASSAIRVLPSFDDNSMIFRLSHIVLDERGYVGLWSDESDRSSATEAFNAFVEELRSQVMELALRYPDEGWAERLDGDSNMRFGPKSLGFVPHVTIARVFDGHNALPLAYSGHRYSARLTEPIELISHRVDLVHYAYSSLFRTVGRISNPIAALPEIGADNIELLLGLKPDYRTN